MSAVPYLIIGSGRLAMHMAHYFDLLGLRYAKWSRRTHTLDQLASSVNQCQRVLLLISDSAIADFAATHQALLINKIVIHCSGALVIDNIAGAHPLMTFNDTPYPLATYRAIPFILEKQNLTLEKLLPGLANPYYYVSLEKKAFYHSLCVMSANFSCLLWQKFFNTLEQEFAIPATVTKIYLQQVLQNLLINPQQALTGPLARGDQKTLEANLQALIGDPYQQVYQAFIHAYQGTI